MCHTLAAYFWRDMHNADKSPDILSAETVLELQPMLLQNGVHISYRLVQWAFVQAGWYNLGVVTVDKVLAACSVGKLRLFDVAAVDS